MTAATKGDIIGGAIVFVAIVALVFGLLCLVWYWDERHWK